MSSCAIGPTAWASVTRVLILRERIDMNINRVIVSGNTTRDAELRQTASGMPVISFGIAVNDRRKNSQTGEWEDSPNFLDVTMFGSRCEKLAQYLPKGTKVAIEGKLRWSQWERDGEKRSKVEIIADDVDFMSRRESAENARPAQADMFTSDCPF